MAVFLEIFDSYTIKKSIKLPDTSSDFSCKTSGHALQLEAVIKHVYVLVKAWTITSERLRRCCLWPLLRNLEQKNSFTVHVCLHFTF